MSDHLDVIRKERGLRYGPVRQNHESIGMIWGGILLQLSGSGRWHVGEPLPPEAVTLMMAGLKASREAYGHQDDNVDDAQNYWRYTGELSNMAEVDNTAEECHCRAVRAYRYDWDERHLTGKTMRECDPCDNARAVEAADRG